MKDKKSQISGENLLSILWLNEWFFVAGSEEKAEESKAVDAYNKCIENLIIED